EFIADRSHHVRREIEAGDAPAEVGHAAKVTAAAATEVEQPAGTRSREQTTALGAWPAENAAPRPCRKANPAIHGRAVWTVIRGVKARDALGARARICVSQVAVPAADDGESQSGTFGRDRVGSFADEFGIVPTAKRAGGFFPHQRLRGGSA